MRRRESRSAHWIFGVAVVTISLVIGTAGNANAQQWTNSGTNILNANAGNVGIGTTLPPYKLSVQGDIDVGAGYANALRFTGSNIYIQENWGFNFAGGNATHPSQFRANTVLIGYTASGANYGTNNLFVAGNVGIGTTAPTKTLDVNGDINVSGNINAKYQDVAEWVAADWQIPPGTVVILDPDRPNRVIPSVAAYDTSVAGVISAKPGITLGEASASNVPVATSGRVRVNVDATRLPIRIGDLLVTSGKPGFAMRSEPIDVGGRRIHQPGTVVGKALEPLDAGVGEILVLVTLQ